MANKKVYTTKLATAGETPITAVVPPISKLTPVVLAYRVTGDDAGALLNFYAGSLITKALHTHADVTTLLVTSTTGFASGDKVLIYDASGNTYYWNSVASVSADPVALELDAVTGFIVDVGDIVYRMPKVAGSIGVGAATVANNSGPNGYCFGNKSMPLVAEVSAGASTGNSITNLSVVYE